jgi:hypothetical protein
MWVSILQFNNIFRYDKWNAFIQKHFESVIAKIRSAHIVQTNDTDSIVSIAASVDGKIQLLYGSKKLPHALMMLFTPRDMEEKRSYVAIWDRLHYRNGYWPSDRLWSAEHSVRKMWEEWTGTVGTWFSSMGAMILSAFYSHKWEWRFWFHLVWKT